MKGLRSGGGPLPIQGARSVLRPPPHRGFAAAAIIYFTSREHYEAYREERLPELQREIEGTSWAKGLAFEHVFELEDI